jgi:hypothetical protein
MKYVKVALGSIAVIAGMLGCIWILQGANILPGSPRTGDIHWAHRGAVVAAIGIALFLLARRKRQLAAV